MAVAVIESMVSIILMASSGTTIIILIKVGKASIVSIVSGFFWFHFKLSSRLEDHCFL